MKHTISITIEHIVVASNRSYEQVIDALEAHLGPARNWEALGQQLLVANASWEQIAQAIEESLGTAASPSSPRRNMAFCSLCEEKLVVQLSTRLATHSWQFK